MQFAFDYIGQTQKLWTVQRDVVDLQTSKLFQTIRQFPEVKGVSDKLQIQID